MKKEHTKGGGKKKAASKTRLSPFHKVSKEIWIGASALVLVWGLIALAFFSTVDRVAPEESEVEEVPEEALEIRHPLTGEVLEEELEELPWVFGVMVENAADAWPLSGLEDAFLVIEAPVEAGIPRFIAFFSEETEIEKVGPVRSARPYYLDWNDEFEAVYTHVGGSPQALDFILDFGTFDLNQFWHGATFYRENGNRYAPHNVYTNSERLIAWLEEALLERGEDEEVPEYESWLFKDDEPAEEGESLAIDFADGTLYDVNWVYEEETNTYLREQAGSTMYMEDGATTSAKNIIVLATDVESIDAVDRKAVRTTGSGNAYVAFDGRVQIAVWKKEERTDRLRLYDEEGKEIAFNAGVTWIEVVDDIADVEIE